MQRIKKIGLSLAVLSVLSLGFTGCGSGGSSNEAQIEAKLEDAQLAPSTLETAEIFLSSDYSTQKINTIKSRSINIEKGTVSGEKTREVIPNSINDSFSETYSYNNYSTEKYDDICKEYEEMDINGITKCNGKFINGTNNFAYKTCVYQTDYSYDERTYFKGGSRYYNFENNIRERNYIYQKGGIKYASQDKYYYEENENLKKEIIYKISGRWYFDDLNQYIEYDSSFDSKKYAMVYDLCTDDDYSGTMQILTKDGKMRFTIVDTNEVLVEISTDGISWNELATFYKQ
ncbi:MAG: hypothetical protein U9Q30_06565 [Campylobacterota bacterium]|nr:hypothetical protein [Campylobacterota bacterium]